MHLDIFLKHNFHFVTFELITATGLVALENKLLFIVFNIILLIKNSCFNFYSVSQLFIIEVEKTMANSRKDNSSEKHCLLLAGYEYQN